MLKGTGVYIYDKEGRVLLILRSPNGKYPLEWEAPGGTVEKDETFELAAVREVKEEVGLDIPMEALSDCFEFKMNNEDGSAWEVRIYRAHADDCYKARICEPDVHCGIGWFWPNEVVNLKLTYSTRTDMQKSFWRK